eukprot:8762-Heterococcus_DN1.PRE.3
MLHRSCSCWHDVADQVLLTIVLLLHYDAAVALLTAATYTQGQTITTTQTITVNHGGYLRIKVCPWSPGAATQACFDSNVLQGPTGSKYWITFGTYSATVPTPPFTVAWTLPPGVSCPNGCLLQWEYTAMQSCIENCNSSICGNAYASKNNPVTGQTGMPSCPTAQGPEAHATSATTLSAGVAVSATATVLVRLALEHCCRLPFTASSLGNAAAVATVNIAAYYCRRDKLHSGESGGYKRKRGKSSSNVLDAAAATNEDDTNSGSGGSDSNSAALSAAKPMIIYFGLINKAHSMCAAATTTSSTSSSSSSSSSSSGDSDSVQSVANWVAQRDSEEVLSLGSALLHHFERELVPAATAEAHIKACASITTAAAAAAANESDLYLTDDTTASDARTAVETVSGKFVSLVQEGELMAACESA